MTCVVQARMGSSRLPGKVVAELAGTSMLTFMLERLSVLDQCHLVVATGDTVRDDPVHAAARSAGVPVVRGSELDVLQRFGVAIAEHPAEFVVRLTGDCPLIDPELVMAAIRLLQETGADYASDTLVRTFPDGLDVEALRAGALQAALIEADDPIEREHVTPFIYRRPERFHLRSLRNDEPLGDERWTVDNADDLAFVRNVVHRFGTRRDFSWREVLNVAGRRARPPLGELHLRPAFRYDSDLLLSLRNDPGAVAFSRTARPVRADEHARWFDRVLMEPASRIWIGEIDGEPIGQVRVDVKTSIGRVSVAIDAAQRGRGLGSELLYLLKRALLADHQITALAAQVHRDNVASRRLFERAGFTPRVTRLDEEFQTLEWGRDTAEL